VDILLSFVGQQDPISEKTNEMGAILTLCQKLQPKIVYLLPSAEGPCVASSTEENARMTREFLLNEVSKGSECFIRPLPLTDPTNFQELLPQVKEAVKNILSELNRSGMEYQLHVNCSSGTPQMTACWYVLANSGFLPAVRLWQAHNPKMVVSGNRVREIKLNFLEEENIISRIRRCLPEYLFGVMAVECRNLQELSLYSHRRVLAEFIGNIFQAYNLWDILKYKEAYQRLAAVEKRWRDTVDAGEAASILHRQVDFLKQLKKEEELETPENLIDIYFNAMRCLARKNYSDTLARFWRIYEGILYYWLRRKWGIEPLDLDKSKNKESKEKVIRILTTRGDKRDNLNLFLAVSLLKDELNDKSFKAAIQSPIKVNRACSWQEMKLEDILEELRKKRNSSIVAHGMKPVTEEDAINSLEAARLLLTKLLPDESENLDKYPLTEENIAYLVNLLAES